MVGYPGGSRPLLLLTSSPARGGAEQYLVALARGATLKGRRTLFAVPQEQRGTGLAAALEGAGAIAAFSTERDVEGGYVQHLLAWLGAGSKVWRHLHRLRPSAAIVSVTGPGGSLGILLALAAANVPTLVVFQLFPDVVKLSMRLRLLRSIRSRRQTWVAVSRTNAAAIARTFGQDESTLVVIPNGCRIGSVATGVDRSQAIRHLLGGDEAMPIVGTVGRICAQKGIADVLDAISILRERNVRARFVWIGPGPVPAELLTTESRRDAATSLVVTGWRDDVEALISGLDLFLFASSGEGMPFALLEAMAAGVPVIASSIPPVLEVLGGRDGALLTPVGDPRALADQVQRALGSSEEMCRRARVARGVAEEYSEDRMTSVTLALADRVALT